MEKKYYQKPDMKTIKLVYQHILADSYATEGDHSRSFSMDDNE